MRYKISTKIVHIPTRESYKTNNYFHKHANDMIQNPNYSNKQIYMKNVQKNTCMHKEA